VAPLSPVMPRRTTLRRPRRAVAAAFTIGLTALAASACGGGNQPTTPLTTTVTVTPPATSSNTATTSTTSTSSTTTTPAAQPPTTYAQAMQHVAAGRVDTGAKAQFTSPTGNIFCSIAAGDVPRGCEVRDGRATPPPGTCDADGGGVKDVGRIEWDGGTPKPICNSDTMFQPGAQVLQYGSTAQVQGSPFLCVSETLGMTCVNTDSKKGFFLAKGAYSLF
jgi:hypothetical protein